MPTAMAREIVIPRLGEFIAAHPLIDLELSSTDRRVDLVHEGFDCVVRGGALSDSELIEVLSQFRAAPMPVSLLYAHRAGLSKRLRALMDWLADVLSPHLAVADRPR